MREFQEDRRTGGCGGPAGGGSADRRFGGGRAPRVSEPRRRVSMRRFRSLLLALAALASLAAVAIPAGSAQGARATRSVRTVRSTGKLTPRLAALASGGLAGRSRAAQ